MLPGLLGAAVAVTADVWGEGGWDVADELIARLRDAGAEAGRWQEEAEGIGVLIYLGEDAREAFHAARAFAGNKGAFVTVSRSGSAGPGALARSCAREWPEVDVRAIEVELAAEHDHEREQDIADALATELLTGGTEPDVVLRADGTRAAWAMLPSPVVSQQSDVSIDSDSVIVISGGGRGVTAACACALATAFRPRIALIGRTPLTGQDDAPELADAHTETQLRAALVAQARRAGERPRPSAIEAELKRVLAVREVRATLAQIEAAGSPVRYLVADVADAASVQAALHEVRDLWGPVTGLVHGAGVLADRLVADKTDEQFDHVMRVKVDGLRNLLDAIADDEPALVCAFSSIVVSAGNAGQTDYAAANEIVEQMALDWRARHPRCLVKAIAWGPWAGGMVTPELAAAFGARDISLIPLAEGAAAFLRELAAPPEQVRALITAGSDTASSASRRGGEIAVSEVAHTWLADHRIADRAVVPLAVALDWMLRLTDDSSSSPDAGTSSARVRDVHVLHAITAPALVTARRSGPALALATSIATGPCYRATLCPSSANALPGLDIPTGLAACVRDPIYDGHVLFHGPSTQTLRRIESIGPGGAVGEVVGGQDAGWPDERWRIDPAALDGAIQLAVVWAYERIGHATLPMSVREAGFHGRGGLEPGVLRCVVRAVSTHAHGAVCDVRLLRPGDDGLVVAALDGLELVARPR